MADAIDQGCDCVLTVGYLSNHTRATVIAAKEMGLQSHVLVINLGTEVGGTLIRLLYEYAIGVCLLLQE